MHLLASGRLGGHTVADAATELMAGCFGVGAEPTIGSVRFRGSQEPCCAVPERAAGADL